MRFLVSFLLIVLFAFIAGCYLPWWSLAIVCFAVALGVPQGLGRSFATGFLAIFLLWAALALWWDIGNGHVLSRKIAALFGLGAAPVLLAFVAALVGGLVGGFAALSGASLRANR
ncbi:hypothetical protein [Flaviaesturariibacter amylovorans]|uniref:Uncharacterized protein n=1 Tax=Flaviaesturariibacter amylovorans TaxID=1084520 RepID=A0ABP8GTA4_9BACT